MQSQGGQLKIIEYYSRCYSRSEERYCTTRLEVTAVISALQHIRKYLIGRKFTLRVDHKAILYYAKTKEPMGQVARHLAFLADFDFVLEYKSGPTLKIPDALSRLRPCERGLQGGPCSQCHKQYTGRHAVYSGDVSRITTRAQARQAEPKLHIAPNGTADSSGVSHPTGYSTRQSASVAPLKPPGVDKASLINKTAGKSVALQVDGWTPAYLREQQRADADIAPALSWLEGVEGRPEWSTVAAASPALCALYQQFESLVLRDVLLPTLR